MCLLSIPKNASTSTIHEKCFKNSRTVMGVPFREEAEVHYIHIAYRTMNQRSSILGTVLNKVAKEADDEPVFALPDLNTDE